MNTDAVRIGEYVVEKPFRLLRNRLNGIGLGKIRRIDQARNGRRSETDSEKDEDGAVLEKDLRAVMAGKVPEAQMGMQIKLVSSPWFRDFLKYDPAPTLSKVSCPVLDINGEKDLQVPPEQNLPAIRKALTAGGNKNFEVVELPGLNHLFQTAKTGGVGEYSEIEETMSPVALEKVANWILKIAG